MSAVGTLFIKNEDIRDKREEKRKRIQLGVLLIVFYLIS